MDARGLDAAPAQQPLQRQLDDLLRFPDDVGPASAFEQGVHRAEPELRPGNVVARELDVVQVDRAG